MIRYDWRKLDHVELVYGVCPLASTLRLGDVLWLEGVAPENHRKPCIALVRLTTKQDGKLTFFVGACNQEDNPKLKDFIIISKSIVDQVRGGFVLRVPFYQEVFPKPLWPFYTKHSDCQPPKLGY